MVNRHTVSDILMDYIDCDREWADQMAGLHDTGFSMRPSLDTNTFIRVCDATDAQGLVRALQAAGCEARCGCTCEIKV